MDFSDATRALLRAQVAPLRHQLALGDEPVAWEPAFELLGLQGPLDLFGPDNHHYLEFSARRGGQLHRESFHEAIGGLIDHETGEVFVNNRFGPWRLNFVIAHEAMHAHLGHCDLMRMPEIDTRNRRGEMEREASYGAVEFLCPADSMRRLLQDATPLGERPGISEVKAVAEHFGVTYFTALRHFVGEVATFPTALVSFRRSRQGGSEHVRMFGYKNRAWIERDLPVVPVELALDVATDQIGWRSYLLLQDLRDQGYLADVREHIERRFRCRAELYTTRESVTALLHGPVVS